MTSWPVRTPARAFSLAGLLPRLPALDWCPTLQLQRDRAFALQIPCADVGHIGHGLLTFALAGLLSWSTMRSSPGRTNRTGGRRDELRMDRTHLLCCLVCLGLCGLAATVGMVILSCQGRDIPPALAAIVATAMGTLGGLLVPARGKGRK